MGKYKPTIFQACDAKIKKNYNSNFHYGSLDLITKIWIKEIMRQTEKRLKKIEERKFIEDEDIKL